MKRWKQVLINPDITIKEALSAINSARSQFLMVVSPSAELLGTLSDGDIRRALLSGATLDSRVSPWMCTTPIVATEENTLEDVLAMMRKAGLHQIPIINDNNIVIGLKTVDEFLSVQPSNNTVVIMAGGLGARLKELTQDQPKPMLPLGGKPLLETIVEKFVSQGFTNIWLSVRYKSEIIEDHFGNGQRLGANIRYLKEKTRLGTAGSLTLLPKDVPTPVIVSNADLVANVDYKKLLDYHLSMNASATMAIHEFEYQIPFGVIRSENGYIREIEEKPTHRESVNAGVYVLSKQAIARLPSASYFDMPQLFRELMINKEKVCSCHAAGYWLDIGQKSEYETACKAFKLMP